MRNAFLLRFAISSVVLLSAASNAAAITDAVKSAARAEKALAKSQPVEAVDDAEAAVAASPQDASYRMLLGRAYLESGRFRSAATSFGDALALDPMRGSAALNQALARLGLGDSEGARELIDAHAARIPAGDRGLALALAGDTAAGIALLEDAIRAGGSNAKTRQNLALSYALAGRWSEAKLMASYDLDPQAVSRRILQWSLFAGADQSAFQVAAVLGVQPRQDAGQPTRLALNMPTTAPVRLAEAAPPPPPPVAMTETAEAPTAPAVEVAVATVAAEAEALFKAPEGVTFAARSEVVQAIVPQRPRIAPRPAVAPVARVQQATFVQPTGGRFVVQIGAYDSVGVAEDAWGRAVRRVSALRELTPSTAVFVQGSTRFYRLSVGGFGTRVRAAAFCEQFRSRGGSCFVREQAGDAPLQWAGRGGAIRFAAR